MLQKYFLLKSECYRKYSEKQLWYLAQRGREAGGLSQAERLPGVLHLLQPAGPRPRPRPGHRGPQVCEGDKLNPQNSIQSQLRNGTSGSVSGEV